jgi:hypothetical protein
LLSGPPNYFFEDAKAFDIILRTDHHNHQQVFFAWKLLTKNKPIVFPKGMPFMFLKNYPVNLLENTKIEYKNISEDLEKKASVDKYQEMLDNFHKTNEPWIWSHYYKKGINGDYPEGIEWNLKPKLMEP